MADTAKYNANDLLCTEGQGRRLKKIDADLIVFRSLTLDVVCNVVFTGDS